MGSSHYLLMPRSILHRTPFCHPRRIASTTVQLTVAGFLDQGDQHLIVTFREWRSPPMVTQPLHSRRACRERAKHTTLRVCSRQLHCLCPRPHFQLSTALSLPEPVPHPRPPGTPKSGMRLEVHPDNREPAMVRSPIGPGHARLMISRALDMRLSLALSPTGVCRLYL